MKQLSVEECVSRLMDLRETDFALTLSSPILARMVRGRIRFDQTSTTRVSFFTSYGEVMFLNLDRFYLENATRDDGTTVVQWFVLTAKIDTTHTIALTSDPAVVFDV